MKTAHLPSSVRLFRFLAICLLTCSLLPAVPVHTDGRWVFENDVLQVQVHEESGLWDVLDKRCGRLWRQGLAPAKKQVLVPVPRVAAASSLDGRLGEWTGEGIPVNSSVSHVSGKADDQDCSARFHFAWDAAGLWLAADVTDDTRSGIVPDVKLWHVDSVELWVGEEHWGFAPAGDRVTVECWSDSKMAENCLAATKITETGWTLEAFVPWNRIVAMKERAEPGKEIRLAFGVNDSDGGTKRQCQLFYPAGYKHKAFSSHALAQLAGPGADTKPQTRLLSRPVPIATGVKPLPAPTEGVQIEYECPREGVAPLPVIVRLWLLSGTGDVGWELSGDLTASFEELKLPAPFILEAEAGKLVIPSAAGLLFGVDELEWAGRRLGGKSSMPWAGAADLDTGKGYLAVCECFDDADFRGAKVAGEKSDVLSVQPVFIPQKGKLGYARRMFYHFMDKGGYVAMAKRYRAYARKTGLLKTLSEKRRERPNIDRLVGAVNMYCSSYAIPELREMGIERAMVSGGFSGDLVRQMNEWGYLPGRYDIYTDLYAPGTSPSEMERCKGFTFPDDVIKNSKGEPEIGWCPIVDKYTGKKVPSYVICWTCGLRVLKEKMPKRLAERPFTSYFLDCVTSSVLRECYDPNHPLTRTQDREARVAQFAYLSKDLGLIVGSETGCDWGAREADYFEGIMSTATFFANPSAIHKIPFETCESTPRYEEYATNPRRGVPLFQLVFGDCTETTWRWGDNSHRMPKLWARKDLLQIAYATMPTWVLWGPQKSLFFGNLDRFKECYDNVCRWRRAVGYYEMINHERLGDDAMVQRSTFANGAVVTVNFATETREIDGVSLPPCSYLITGNAPELSGLLVGKPVQVSYKWESTFPEPTGNTGFEKRPNTWSATKNMSLEVQSDVVHDGSRAAKISGETTAGGWSFASTVKMPLKAGDQYRVTGWVRIDALEPSANAPALKCGVYNDKGWMTNLFTPDYDLAKMGTWQKLEKTFTVPEGGIEGRMSLEKRTKDAVTATLYLDDVELVRVEGK